MDSESSESSCKYENCDWCNKCYPLYQASIIKTMNIDDLCVCPKCNTQLKSESYIIPDPEEPNWGYFTVNRETDKREFYTNWSDFELHVNELDLSLYQVGCWKRDPERIKSRLLGSFLGTSDCGMIIEDVRECLQNPYTGESLYIGFREHTVPEINNIFDIPSLDITNLLMNSTINLPMGSLVGIRGFKISNRDDKEQMLKEIKIYIDDIECQMLAVTHNSTEYRTKDLLAFCFPDRNPYISVFDTLEQLVAAKWDWREATKNTEWLVTHKYLNEKKTRLQNLVSNVLSEILELEDIRPV